MRGQDNCRETCWNILYTVWMKCFCVSGDSLMTLPGLSRDLSNSAKCLQAVDKQNCSSSTVKAMEKTFERVCAQDFLIGRECLRHQKRALWAGAGARAPSTPLSARARYSCFRLKLIALVFSSKLTHTHWTQKQVCVRYTLHSLLVLFSALVLSHLI